MASQFINPLPMIGQSTNQPDVAGTNKALRDLQTRHLLTEMQQTGAAERSAASDLSRLTGSLAPYGLSPTSIKQPGTLSTILRQKAAESGGKAASSFADAGIRDIGKGTYKPGDFYKREVTPGQLLRGEAQEKAKLDVMRQLGETRKFIERDPVRGFTQVERRQEFQQKGQNKDSTRKTQQRVEELQRIVANEFGRNAEIVGETDTHLLISIDGAEPVKVKMNIVKRK